MIKVAELHTLEGTLADPGFQQQVEGEPVTAVVRNEDRPLLIQRERRPLDAAFLRRADRPRRVAVQLPAQDGPLKEPFENRDVLRPRPRRLVAPLLVNELFEPLGADRRLEVL